VTIDRRVRKEYYRIIEKGKTVYLMNLRVNERKGGIANEEI